MSFSHENVCRKIIIEKLMSQKEKNVAIKPLKMSDVVQVYKPAALDELIGTHEKNKCKKVSLARERSIRKRRFRNVILGITFSDLIEIAQQ